MKPFSPGRIGLSWMPVMRLIRVLTFWLNFNERLAAAGEVRKRDFVATARDIASRALRSSGLL